MKKIFTLLFAVGFLTAAYAQPGTRDTRQTDQRDKEYNQRNDQQNSRWYNQGNPTYSSMESKIIQPLLCTDVN